MVKNKNILLTEFLVDFNNFLYRLYFTNFDIWVIYLYKYHLVYSFKKAEKITYQTDILFDEEENVKM
ncbi:MAG: hypothetical protein ACLTEH_03550 [Clostridia bacterium]